MSISHYLINVITIGVPFTFVLLEVAYYNEAKNYHHFTKRLYLDSYCKMMINGIKKKLLHEKLLSFLFII